MPIILRENQYRGVNAHLHSALQANGQWPTLHTPLITLLGRALNRQLPTGYLVKMEQSLQIREFNPHTGERIQHRKPDLTIYREKGAPSVISPPASATLPTLTLPLTELLAAEFYETAAVIYETQPDDVFGRPVTRIEVLSPTNKIGNGYDEYLIKREAGLQGRVALVEIDLLHETPPILRELPRYPQHPDAHAYSIAVSEPYPSFYQGSTRIYGFDVETPLPRVAIPLGKQNTIVVDFDAVYQETYASFTAYSLYADYAQLPAHIERYSEADQARIRARMEAVRAQHGEQA